MEFLTDTVLNNYNVIGCPVSLGSEKDEPEVTEKHADSDEYVMAILLFYW